MPWKKTHYFRWLNCQGWPRYELLIRLSLPGKFILIKNYPDGRAVSLVELWVGKEF